jgi:hypothetical protein
VPDFSAVLRPNPRHSLEKGLRIRRITHSAFVCKLLRSSGGMDLILVSLRTIFASMAMVPIKSEVGALELIVVEILQRRAGSNLPAHCSC